MRKKTPFEKKIVACFVLSVLLSSTILLLGTDRGDWLRPAIIFSVATILFILPYIGLAVWEYREKKRSRSLLFLYYMGNDVIAVLTGFCIAIFGWKKIFGLQFRTPLSLADLPMSSQNGEALTWFYFGHSHIFGLIIACLQLAGSFLLLFRRTRLLAVFILLPVMLNITLINIFYQMNIGALFQSLALTGGVLYLMAQHCKAIIAFFSTTAHTAWNSKNHKWLTPVLCISVSFLYIFFDQRRIPKESPVYGAYKVKNMVLNGKEVTLDSCQHNAALLTSVYFDLNNVCVMEYNKPGNRLIANYDYRETDQSIQCLFMRAGKPVALHISIDKKKNRETVLSGNLGSDSLHLVLLQMR